MSIFDFDWLVDRFDGETVINAYFILSDLVDINLTEAEICESACFDSLANATVSEHKGDSKIPLGKQVY